MGQQQLLLLVFGIVLVGGVVVAGAHALEAGNSVNNRTLVFQETLAMVNDIQAWSRTPLARYAAVGRSVFAGLDFKKLGLRPTLLSNRVYKSDNACFVLRDEEAGHGVRLIVTAPSCAKREYVAHVTITGAGPGDLDWRHDPSMP